MSKPILTQSELKQILHYSPETGEVFWTGNKKWTDTSKEAGYINKYGYRIIMIHGKNYSAHRLIWLYVYGELPKHQIDHINHDRADNRICNLREVTNQQNQMNRRYAGNSSGHIGVCWDKARNKWKPHIKVNQKLINLGRFDTLEEAIAVRKTAEAKHGFHANHGIKLTD